MYSCFSYVLFCFCKDCNSSFRNLCLHWHFLALSRTRHVHWCKNLNNQGFMTQNILLIPLSFGRQCFAGILRISIEADKLSFLFFFSLISELKPYPHQGSVLVGPKLF
ncbi:hypothetical protein ISN45_Aa03g017750 [Arabidopsis thaliana x Arabidopsis arenosa]|uniref:Uncharacterized protein n=1 Tax=Arabidopsis thaliana x Arabidopsis arenosa TaxID=1240361 RepID=A0A8T2ATP1_9BRAS|nr:hypothetical protein ISN45_Aa03g017750 [Arabidopsis thaliana x Arabidopsis arenosa]